ncbi:hypothetical protein ACEPAH_1540 [Sanghuangporus vaninii]
MGQKTINLDLNLPPLPLPEGIESKYISVNDLIVHFLDAHPNRPPTDGIRPPLIILVHGFPELAYSWRKIMRPLADLGFRVVATDQRGFGRTVPNPNTKEGSNASVAYPYEYQDPLSPFSFANLVRDDVAFVYALGYDSVACVMGHDSGSITASSCALVRPDIYRSVVLMSAPFLGTPDTPFNSQTHSSLADAISAGGLPKPPHMGLAVDAMLASLDPPRMYYQHYYSLPQANIHMHKELSTKQLHDFMRAYFHIKSACWPDSSSSPEDVENFTDPRALKSIEEIAYLPPYYMMPRGESMSAVVGARLPRGDDLERARAWLRDADVDVFTTEYGRTGFQGGLNRYRVATRLGCVGDTLNSISASEQDYISELTLFARKKIEVPALFVAGDKDWGPYQYPGAFDKMRSLCPLMRPGNDGITFIKDAGHWVQQENPEDLLVVLKAFLLGLKLM